MHTMISCMYIVYIFILLIFFDLIITIILNTVTYYILNTIILLFTFHVIRIVGVLNGKISTNTNCYI